MKGQSVYCSQLMYSWKINSIYESTTKLKRKNDTQTRIGYLIWSAANIQSDI